MRVNFQCANQSDSSPLPGKLPGSASPFMSTPFGASFTPLPPLPPPLPPTSYLPPPMVPPPLSSDFPPVRAHPIPPPPPPPPPTLSQTTKAPHVQSASLATCIREETEFERRFQFLSDTLFPMPPVAYTGQKTYRSLQQVPNTHLSTLFLYRMPSIEIYYKPQSELLPSLHPLASGVPIDHQVFSSPAQPFRY
ncbi:unnamed protein product [Protopolystoma xenopodis]|uniref:Uncharacterized protein n=1 Tax=Protopolystoma xenopodis TaxID=117903 RepID=A0A448WAT0_9PLAT|nr:unnamed protein product [Protopolystoma xenopodis]